MFNKIFRKMFGDKTPVGIDRGRVRFHDEAILYRMRAGFAGQVNRSHPASIEPGLLSPTVPPVFAGQAVLVDPATDSYRAIGATDTAITTIDAITVRAFPLQQQTGGMTASIGTSGLPVGSADFARQAYIMVNVPAGQTATKKGAVFIWTAASTGTHVQGGFETVFSAGNTTGAAGVGLTNCRFNGQPDTFGDLELVINNF